MITMGKLVSSHIGLSIGVLFIFLSGCLDNNSPHEDEWSIEHGGLSLKQELLVGDDEPFYFGDLDDVSVGKDGRIYGADGESGNIKVIGPSGELLDTLGQRGRGPGEFKQFTSLVLSRGDSLYILDEQNRRVSVFSPSGTIVRSFLVASEHGVPEKLLVPDGHSEVILVNVMVPWPDLPQKKTLVVLRVGRSGDDVDTLFTTKRKPMFGTRRKGVQMFIPIPFAPAPHVEMGPKNRILLARGDSLAVKIHGFDEGVQQVVSIPFRHVPVTEEDKTRALKNLSEGRSMPRNKIPSTKPAFTQFLIDDRGRYWFGRPTANPDSTDWWMAWPDEQRVVTTTLPSQVRLHAVTNGRAYGQTTTDNGAPALVRYRLRLDD